MTDPTPSSSASPPLTAIVVVRNDAATLPTAIDSLLTQSYGGDLHIVIAVSPSTDGTGDLAAALAAEHPRISVLEFASSSLVVGVNEAIAAARTSLVIRVDPRAALPEGFATEAVAAMARTDAVALVARITPVGTTSFERAVSLATLSSVGLARDPLTPYGEVSAAAAGPERQAQSAFAHVIRRRTFIEIGLYNEEIRHGQGWELNERLREAGHTVWFEPALHLDYRPPSRVVDVTRSLFAEGLWRGEFARAFPEEKVLRFFLPSLVVIVTILAFILGAVGFFGLVAGALGVAAVVSVILFALLVVPVVYLVGVVVLAISAMVRTEPRTGLWFALVLPLVHFSWGFGFIAGFVNLEGAADTVIVDFD
ncbi:glycosyltransferase [Subtercola sp. YIM 133946]|uniref:glycosyltransferase n=1 Tax=Subtercola sp. YIM 133946 TaxID=3118909 RepID=UPI002F93D117